MGPNQPARNLRGIDHQEPGDCGAGEFRIDNPEQEQPDWIATIRLNLSVVRTARAKGWIDGSDALTSLSGIGSVERYAGVLGHELAHASQILESPEYARLHLEIERETAAYHLARKTMDVKEYNKPEMQGRMQWLQSLMDRIEEPVNSIEVELWRELLARQRSGTGRK